MTRTSEGVDAAAAVIADGDSGAPCGRPAAGAIHTGNDPACALAGACPPAFEPKGVRTASELPDGQAAFGAFHCGIAFGCW
ncbi:hypothetical protein ACIGXM_28180 [Kitasatospora sp. NPDC052896]|uniref:hypothetical protein n=1 Tax=Kitasatospora sp. NPDC052896 TaxID=3364061 RepID=UPI0037CC9F36